LFASGENDKIPFRLSRERAKEKNSMNKNFILDFIPLISNGYWLLLTKGERLFLLFEKKPKWKNSDEQISNTLQV
jgi:hypothetical protein